MCIRDRGKAESVSLRCMGGVSLIKFIKYMVQGILAQHLAVILYYNMDCVFFPIAFYGNTAALRRKFHGVFQEIPPGVRHELQIAASLLYTSD